MAENAHQSFQTDAYRFLSFQTGPLGAIWPFSGAWQNTFGMGKEMRKRRGVSGVRTVTSFFCRTDGFLPLSEVLERHRLGAYRRANRPELGSNREGRKLYCEALQLNLSAWQLAITPTSSRRGDYSGNSKPATISVANVGRPGGWPSALCAAQATSRVTAPWASMKRPPQDLPRRVGERLFSSSRHAQWPQHR